jgi:hypothetical protein
MPDPAQYTLNLFDSTALGWDSRDYHHGHGMSPVGKLFK